MAIGKMYMKLPDALNHTRTFSNTEYNQKANILEMSMILVVSATDASYFILAFMKVILSDLVVNYV